MQVHIVSRTRVERVPIPVWRRLSLVWLNKCLWPKRRLDYPEFIEAISNYDIMCATETKLDHTDVISVPGYCFLTQHRRQKIIRKSGGIGVFHCDRLSTKIKAIETESDNILWLRLDKSLFDINADLILGILYVPPTQSRFLNDNEYFNLETENVNVRAIFLYLFNW